LKRPAAHQKDNFPKRIGPVSGPVRFVLADFDLHSSFVERILRSEDI
jgi:hypothetical protein